MGCRRQHRKRPDVARAPDFVKVLQKKVRNDPGKGIRSLAREIDVRVATVNLVLSEDLRHHSCTRGKGELLTTTAQNNLPKIAEELLKQAETSRRKGTPALC